MPSPVAMSPELADALERSRQLGFLGPGDINVHVHHARSFLGLIDDDASVLDLGSGGGLPGFVLVDERPDLSVVLLDAMEKRVAFLRDVLRHTGWDLRASTRVGRAEELAREPDLRGRFDVVVVRSFGPPAATAECAVGFLRPGGTILVSEPEDGRNRWPGEELKKLSLVPLTVEVSKHARVQPLQLVGECPEQYPRRVGVPVRKPLFPGK